MKLGLHTFGIGGEFTIDQLAETWVAAGFDGIEFRCEMGQRHGVDPNMGAGERQALVRTMKAAGLEIIGLGTSQRFEYPEAERREAAIARAKDFIHLAADLGAPRIRVYGNTFPAGVPTADVVAYVTAAVAECGHYAEQYGVDVMFHMHGDFNDAEYCLPVVRGVASPRVALDYNSDARDVVNGSVAAAWHKVRDHVRHVHVHGIEEGVYPYRELFRLLKDSAYRGYVTMARHYTGGGERMAIILYGALLREMVENA